MNTCAYVQALPGQQQAPENVPQFKLVLVGDGGTGTPYISPSFSLFSSFPSNLPDSPTPSLETCCPPTLPGKTTFVKRHLTGEFERAYNRASLSTPSSCALSVVKLVC